MKRVDENVGHTCPACDHYVMTTAGALTLIFKERDSQAKAWPRTNNQYEYASPHILLLEEQILKLRTEWYTDSDKVKERIVKTAAIALRALEEIKYYK